MKTHDESTSTINALKTTYTQLCDLYKDAVLYVQYDNTTNRGEALTYLATLKKKLLLTSDILNSDEAYPTPQYKNDLLSSLIPYLDVLSALPKPSLEAKTRQERYNEIYFPTLGSENAAHPGDLLFNPETMQPMDASYARRISKSSSSDRYK